MKKLSLKYVGAKTVRALLERYACPIPFHIVRMRFLGNIATPKLDASPIETIKSFWGGELPEFDNRAAVNELFEALMSLWNELARHQSVTKPVQLVRMAIKPDPGNLIRLCQTRTEELEGFIDGLFGDEEVINLPKRANEALSHLADINAMLHGILDLMAREPAPSASGEDMMSTFNNLTSGERMELSRIVEKELHAVVLSGKRARQQAIQWTSGDPFAMAFRQTRAP